jgi:putative transposase
MIGIDSSPRCSWFPRMARKLRVEFEGACYHALNRGNYRADVFAQDSTKKAFSQCVGEAFSKARWRLHASNIMRNHFHLAQETPVPNLSAGMQWLLGTFATRFNRFRNERGHLFQGRYKSILVEPGADLGALCHYIHLNPVRAKILPVERLQDWRWGSFAWLMNPSARPPWYSPMAALAAAGGLADTPAGRRSYQEYLVWLAADEAEQKQLGFDKMSRGWALGCEDFKKSILADEQARVAALEIGASDSAEARTLVFQHEVTRLLGELRDVARADARKFADWKIATAAVLKERTTATNREIADRLGMGSPFTVSRLAVQCRKGGRGFAIYCMLTAKCQA